MMLSQLPVTIMTRLSHAPCAHQLQWECSVHAIALVIPSDRDRYPIADVTSELDAVTLHSLGNGCVLCNVDKSLSQALDELSRQHATGRRRFGRVVVMTRADQIGTVVEVLFTHKAIGQSCMLDVIVLLIDTADLVPKQSIPSGWTQYIGLATHIVIANTALLYAAALALLRRRIARINQNVRVQIPARTAPIDQVVYLGTALHC
jgi:G3E family GTPase